MTTTKVEGVAVVAEVADVLWRHGQLPCTPVVKEEDGLITLTLTLRPATVGEALDGLEVLAELQRVADVAQMRAFAGKYGIAAEEIDPALRKVLGS